MTDYTLIILGSYSIGIAAIIGLVRLRNIHASYRPFILIITMSLVVEIISHILIYFKKSNAIAVNVFGLIEGLLWLRQFRKWNTTKDQVLPLKYASILITSIWIIENIIAGKLFSFSSVYAILFSFMVIFYSINQMNRQLTEEKGNLFTNARFLICCGTIIFFTYRILVECFFLLDLQKSASFFAHVFIILAFVNLIVNLLFAIATLWIPARQKFSFPY
ncbi:MAG TPA: hypothetical protein VM101_15690 [Flavitalea sp.]|nr:hypothetical protein [Flavitalea sp.]